MDDDICAEFEGRGKCLGPEVAQIDVSLIIDRRIYCRVRARALAQVDSTLLVEADLPHISVVVGRVKDGDLAVDLHREDRLLVEVQASRNLLHIRKVTLRIDRMIGGERFKAFVHIGKEIRISDSL